MMEHALFFAQLMPGPDLEPIRRQAADFNLLFAQQFEQSRLIDVSNYVAINQRSMDLARRFSDYKKSVRDQQNAGRWHTLVFPLFFTHTAREADRFAARLAMYNRGSIEFKRGEVVDFWSKTMSEQSAFIAHLLDPTEGLLIDQAIKLENASRNPAAFAVPRPIPSWRQPRKSSTSRPSARRVSAPASSSRLSVLNWLPTFGGKRCGSLTSLSARRREDTRRGAALDNDYAPWPVTCSAEARQEPGQRQ
jgi:hypothetical protein